VRISPVSQYELALLVHLLGVGVLAAGMGVAAAAFEAGRRRASAREVALLLRLTRAGVVLVAAGTLVLLAGGFWLMEIGSYDLEDGWLAASLALVVLGALLGALGGARSKRARLYAESVAGQDRPVDATLRRLLDDRVALALNYGSAAVMLVVLALMVVKPS
jgi:uncharacterized membrane protein